jgi:hypothetical protein
VTKLDHANKGGRYQPDPARTQPHDDFVEPDDVIVRKGRKKPLGLWAIAMKTLRKRDHVASNPSLTQAELLSALGYSQRDLRKQRGAEIRKHLVREGLLHVDGKPNLDHHKVVGILSERRRAR